MLEMCVLERCLHWRGVQKVDLNFIFPLGF